MVKKETKIVRGQAHNLEQLTLVGLEQDPLEYVTLVLLMC